MKWTLMTNDVILFRKWISQLLVASCWYTYIRITFWYLTSQIFLPDLKNVYMWFAWDSSEFIVILKYTHWINVIKRGLMCRNLNNLGLYIIYLIEILFKMQKKSLNLYCKYRTAVKSVKPRPKFKVLLEMLL